MKTVNTSRTVALLGVLLLGWQTANAGEFVTYGEYISTLTTHGGERGVFSGNNQDMVFRGDGGEIVWSSRGGWVSGAQGQRHPDQISARRERMRQEQADKDREVREGRRSVEYGEYISRGTTFHGYRGHWSGNAKNQVFVSSEYGVIYSSNGGWVTGFGPEFEPVESKWGVGISDDANVYTDISDPNTLRRTSSLQGNRLYAVVERGRSFVTASYYVGGKVYLSNTGIPDGAIIPASMLNRGGAGKFRFVKSGNGYRFDPLQ